MKVELNGNYGVYGKKVSKESTSAKNVSAEAGKKAAETDVVDISRGNTTISDKSFMTLKSNLQREINQPASSERLEQLRSDVKNGTYRIPTEALIDSILGD